MRTRDLSLEDHKLRQELREWFRQPAGQLLSTAERAELDRVLPNLFGYHLVQVGAVSDQDFSGESRVRHKVVLDPDRRSGARGCAALPEALPLASDSVDALVLQHTLDFTTDPYAVLREADRVLVPEGHVVVIGFNPVSLWGLGHLLFAWRGRVPWCGRFLSQTRVKDWLKLLGFQPMASRSFFFRPPAGREALLRRLGWLERLDRPGLRPMPGGVYVVVARKKVIGMTPIKPRWRMKRSLSAPGGIVEPTPRKVARVG